MPLARPPRQGCVAPCAPVPGTQRASALGPTRARPCPAVAKRPDGGVFGEKTQRRALTRTLKTAAGVILGSLFFAVAVYGLLALPGLISDRDSTVPLIGAQHAQR